MDRMNSTERELAEALDCIEDMVHQHCSHPDGYLDSWCVSANADAIRLLCKHERATLMKDFARVVTAKPREITT